MTLYVFVVDYPMVVFRKLGELELLPIVEGIIVAEVRDREWRELLSRRKGVGHLVSGEKRVNATREPGPVHSHCPSVLYVGSD